MKVLFLALFFFGLSLAKNLDECESVCETSTNVDQNDTVPVIGTCKTGNFQKCSASIETLSECCQKNSCFKDAAAFKQCCHQKKTASNEGGTKGDVCLKKLKEHIETRCIHHGGVCVHDLQSYKGCCRKTCTYKDLQKFCCKP